MAGGIARAEQNDAGAARQLLAATAERRPMVGKNRRRRKPESSGRLSATRTLRSAAAAACSALQRRSGSASIITTVLLIDPAFSDPDLGDPALGDPALGDPALGGPDLGDRGGQLIGRHRSTVNVVADFRQSGRTALCTTGGVGLEFRKREYVWLLAKPIRIKFVIKWDDPARGEARVVVYQPGGRADTPARPVMLTIHRTCSCANVVPSR